MLFFYNVLNKKRKNKKKTLKTYAHDVNKNVKTFFTTMGKNTRG